MKKINTPVQLLVLLSVCLLVVFLAACASATPTQSASDEAAKPSNPGGPGAAVNLTGDPVAGKVVFDANCVACHGQDGKGGVANPGSEDGTVPALNPIDSTLASKDAKTFATNINLFIEHGSTPKGGSPTLKMLPLGDNKTLTPQQIADVTAYVISLNK